MVKGTTDRSSTLRTADNVVCSVLLVALDSAPKTVLRVAPNVDLEEEGDLVGREVQKGGGGREGGGRT